MSEAVELSKHLNASFYKDGKRTVVEDSKLSAIEELARIAQMGGGDFAEVGVWRGGVGILLGEVTKNSKNPPLICLFDTFEGIPYSNEKDNFHKAGDFATEDDDTDYDEVCKTLSVYKNIYIYKGIFPADTGAYINANRFSLVHIDVDVYQSYLDCLEFFLPRMVKGGVILLDDYKVKSCEGATLACDEFVKKYGLSIHEYKTQHFIQL